MNAPLSFASGAPSDRSTPASPAPSGGSAVRESASLGAITSAWPNPMGTDGFEFIEYAAPDPEAMAAVFQRMGFTAIAKHRHKNVTLYRQGGINFIINAEPDSFAQRFARQHGPSVCAIAFWVQDAKQLTNAPYRWAPGAMPTRPGRVS